MPTITPEGIQLSTVAHVGTLANQRAYAVNVTYPNQWPVRVIFLGTPNEVGPVVMIIGEAQFRVDDPSRFGAFGPEWVERFFQPEPGAYGIQQVTSGTPDAMTCGTCGRSWLEDITPAGRCPWEERH